MEAGNSPPEAACGCISQAAARDRSKPRGSLAGGVGSFPSSIIGRRPAEANAAPGPARRSRTEGMNYGPSHSTALWPGSAHRSQVCSAANQRDGLRFMVPTILRPRAARRRGFSFSRDFAIRLSLSCLSRARSRPPPAMSPASSSSSRLSPSAPRSISCRNIVRITL
jgi:hypothetical protein